MWSFAKPTQIKIERFLAHQQTAAFSYPYIGDTKRRAPNGFKIQRSSILLGQGQTTFAAACRCLRQWKQLPPSWTEIYPAQAKLRRGNTLVMLVRYLGIWWLNSCRIVYLIDEDEPHHRFGFAYGTLPGHMECGEERFLIERDEQDNVWYEIYSFSQPRHWLARLAFPLARRAQKKFVSESLSQLKKLVTAQCPPDREAVPAGCNENTVASFSR